MYSCLFDEQNNFLTALRFLSDEELAAVIVEASAGRPRVCSIVADAWVKDGLVEAWARDYLSAGVVDTARLVKPTALEALPLMSSKAVISVGDGAVYESADYDCSGHKIDDVLEHNATDEAGSMEAFNDQTIKVAVNHYCSGGEGKGNVVCKYGPISRWNTSKVTAMTGLFHNIETFNEDLNAWNVANVTNMREMFHGALSFNGDLNKWKVSNVTDMRWMFKDAKSFNGDLSTWNVSSVADMHSLFWGATKFNSDVSTWEVGSVTKMGGMFFEASSFNGDLSAWIVSRVTTMEGMFWKASSFNNDLSAWDVTSVTNMQHMFCDATSFNGDLSAWNVNRRIRTDLMFKGALISSLRKPKGL